uniref:Uncharacterized protein n=1 Tax=Physcomitrium patens TaxID=3218 RepID=A0A7I3Z6A0_PHYPA
MQNLGSTVVRVTPTLSFGGDLREAVCVRDMLQMPRFSRWGGYHKLHTHQYCSMLSGVWLYKTLVDNSLFHLVFSFVTSRILQKHS